MPTLLTFGDSNTHGTLPIKIEGQRERLGPDARWPGITTATLGPDWTLLEEGLPGRTTCHPDPEMGPHMDGRVGLFIALESHGPIDFLTIMLGTNDLKSHFQVSADEISRDINTLLEIALSEELQERHDIFDILLICPPPIFEKGVLGEKFNGGRAKSTKLAELYQQVADAHHVDFLDAGKAIESSEIDGIHFAEEMHMRLGSAVAIALQDMVVVT